MNTKNNVQKKNQIYIIFYNINLWFFQYIYFLITFLIKKIHKLLLNKNHNDFKFKTF